jgi:hypothetical protein
VRLFIAVFLHQFFTHFAHTRGMAARSCPRNIDIPLFLAPAFADARASQLSRRQFVTSSARCQQHNTRSKEKNKKRGVSAIRSTGPRVALNVNRYPLPTPADNAAEARKQFKTNENHGLWGFFTVDKRAMLSPEEESAFGMLQYSLQLLGLIML